VLIVCSSDSNRYFWPKITTQNILDGCWWLMPVILATQEAEIRRITVRSQLRQIVPETLPLKNPSQK
jgi:hypothetical protein